MTISIASHKLKDYPGKAYFTSEEEISDGGWNCHQYCLNRQIIAKKGGSVYSGIGGTVRLEYSLKFSYLSGSIRNE
jgi:hypothetical protein